MKCRTSSDIQGVCADIDLVVKEGSNGAGASYHRRFYALHSTCIFAFLASGMILNGGNRKYIPVNPNELLSLQLQQSDSSLVSSNDEAESERGACTRAYVNVHSSSVGDDFAAVCCGDFDDRINVSNSNDQLYHANLCHPRMPVLGLPPHRVPFALRLSRPLEAWVLPLLPILIRLVFQLWMLVHSALLRWNGCKGNDSSTSVSQSITTTLRRLLFYFLLLNFRGWCLYIGANAVEDYIILPWLTGYTVVSPLRTNSMSDVDHDLYSNTEPGCWYKGVLKAHHRLASETDEHVGCYGRSFDFSDHVVLFLAHYLPIFVMEMLIYRASPFWDTSATEQGTTKRRWTQYIVSRRTVWNFLHSFMFLYMHLILFQALKQTATYFHTPAETLVGFGISMIVQVPMIYLMCSERSLWIKQYIGLPYANSLRLVEKGE